MWNDCEAGDDCSKLVCCHYENANWLIPLIYARNCTKRLNAWFCVCECVLCLTSKHNILQLKHAILSIVANILQWFRLANSLPRFHFAPCQLRCVHSCIKYRVWCDVNLLRIRSNEATLKWKYHNKHGLYIEQVIRTTNACINKINKLIKLTKCIRTCLLLFG